jgi:hypothetical protein
LVPPPELTLPPRPVDVETAGPAPWRYSLLSIGACLVENLERRFYVELKPDHQALDPQAAASHGLSLDRLRLEGMPPAGVVEFAVADAHDHAPGRLVFGGIGQKDPAGGLLLALLTLDDDAVTEGDEARLSAGGLGGCG